jgi:hypothetical protein
MKRTYARYFNLMRMVYTLLIIVIIDSDPRRENILAPPLNCPCRVMEQYRPTTGQIPMAGAGDHRISRVDATVRHSDGAPVDQ